MVVKILLYSWKFRNWQSKHRSRKFVFSHQMLSIDKKATFSIKSIYLYNLLYPAALKTLTTCGGVILALSFFVDITFLDVLLF